MHRQSTLFTLLLSLALALVALGCTTPPRANAPAAATAPAVPEQPRAPELDFLLGQELEMDGKLPEAYQAYQRALERDPRPPTS